jgi:hypothetical protein
MVADLIMGETSIKEYLQDPGQIVFLFQNNYYGIDKETIRNLLKDTTGNSPIFYECLEPDTLREGNVVKTNPLFNLHKIGIPASFVRLSEINTILNDSSHQVYSIEKTEPVKKFASTVSKGYYDTGNAVSAAHCQTGQEGFLYKISIQNYQITETGGKRKTRKINKTKTKKIKTKKIKTKKIKKTKKPKKTKKTKKPK